MALNAHATHLWRDLLPEVLALLAGGSEQAMIFLGLLVLSDPLKGDIPTTVRELADLGVRLKIITGDNAAVASLVLATLLAGILAAYVLSAEVVKHWFYRDLRPTPHPPASR